MSISLAQFEAQLVASGLFSADEVQALRGRMDAPPAAADQFAAALVEQHELTRYQADQLLQDRPPRLVFDEYAIVDRLDAGGAAAIYKARDRRMNRTVAIRSITDAAPDVLARLRSEVESAARLNHPNLVTVYDVCEVEGQAYLVLEYVAGRDLAAELAARGRLPLIEAMDYVLQAAAGLDYAHRRGIVHGAVRPGHLLRDEEGNIKVLPTEFVAAEAAGDAAPDPRTDIHGLGCTLFRLVTAAADDQPAASLQAALPTVPDEVERVYRQMVADQPEQRQQTLGEVIAQLEAAAAVAIDVDDGEFAHPVSVNDSSSEPAQPSATGDGEQLGTGRPPANGAIRWVLVVLAALVIGGLLAWSQLF